MINLKNKIIVVLLLTVIAVCSVGCGSESVVVRSSEETETENGQTEVEGTEADSGQEASDMGDFTEKTEAEEKICVFVCGAVKKEGVYELPAGARVNDALLAAGGFSEDAAEDVMNLAAYIEDGQKLYFPTEEEAMDPAFDETGLISSESEPTTGSQAQTQKVNINTAEKEELMTLSGIGEAKAESILTYRAEHGAFQEIDEIMNVSGIGENLFNRIKSDICVE